MSETIPSKTESIILPMFAHPDAKHRKILARIEDLSRDALRHAGVSLLRRRLATRLVMWRIKAAARRGQSFEQIEALLRPRFRRVVNEADYSVLQKKRAVNAYGRIKDYLVGEHLLDLGSGTGIVAQTIHERTGMKVTLADVINYSMTDLPTVIISQDSRIPLENDAVDTTLLYLVLHHADDPLRLLEEAVRVTRTRMVIMEGYVDDEETYLVNCYFDWFLNRVVEAEDINIPLNFRTTGEWQQIFAQHGLRLVRQELVGIDEPLAPESHVLFVLDKVTEAQRLERTLAGGACASGSD